MPTSLQNDGRPRTFVLHVPAGLTGPAPLVVALHAHSQTTDKVRAYTRLEALADEQGFVVAFPSGAGGSWNAGGCCRPGSDLGTDDVGFLDEVLELAQDRAPVDPAQISLTGSSNGGMMALRYACERADAVSSVAVVGAPLMEDCTPSRPVDVLVLQGELDGVVPVGGGAYPPLGVVFPPVDASLAPFRTAGGEVELRVLPGAGPRLDDGRGARHGRHPRGLGVGSGPPALTHPFGRSRPAVRGAEGRSMVPVALVSLCWVVLSVLVAVFWAAVCAGGRTAEAALLGSVRTLPSQRHPVGLQERAHG